MGVSIRTYKTTVLSDDGLLQAEVLSLPNSIDPALARPDEVLRELAESLDADIRLVADDLAYEQSLQHHLTLMAQQAARRAGALDSSSVDALVEAVAHEPVVVTEQPPVGTSLNALLKAEAGYGYFISVEGKPLLATGVGTVAVLVSFAPGPIKAVRKGASQATEVAIPATAAA